MAEQKIQLIIEAQNKADAALNGLQKQLGATEGSVTSLKDRLTDLSRQTGIAFAAFGAAATAITGMLAKSAMEAERSWAIVERQLTLAGLPIEANIDRVKEFATQMQNVTGRSDEMIGSFVGKLLPAVGSLEKAFEAAEVALDITADTGEDMNSVVRQMMMAMTGNIEVLRRWVPSIRELTKEQLDNMTQTEKTAFALDALRGHFGGVAAKEGAQAMGRLRLLKLTVGDLAESMGNSLLPAIKEISEKITALVQKLDGWVQKNPELAGTIVKVVAVLGPLSIAIGALLLALPTLAASWHLVAGGIKAVTVAAMANPIFAIGVAVVGLTTLVLALASAWDKTASAHESALKKVLAGTNIMSLANLKSAAQRDIAEIKALPAPAETSPIHRGQEFKRRFDIIREKEKEIARLDARIAELQKPAAVKPATVKPATPLSDEAKKQNEALQKMRDEAALISKSAHDQDLAKHDTATRDILAGYIKGTNQYRDAVTLRAAVRGEIERKYAIERGKIITEEAREEAERQGRLFLLLQESAEFQDEAYRKKAATIDDEVKLIWDRAAAEAETRGRIALLMQDSTDFEDESYRKKAAAIDDEVKLLWDRAAAEAETQGRIALLWQGEAVTATQRQAAREADIVSQIAELDLLEASGTAHRETLTERIRLHKILLALRQADLALVSKEADPTGYYAQLDKITQTRASLITLGQEQQAATDSFTAGWDRGLKDYINRLDSTFDQAKKLADGAAKALEQSFSDFFFDAFTGKLKSLEDYLNSFFNSVARAVANAMGQQMSTGISGMFQGLFSGAGSAGGVSLMPMGDFPAMIPVAHTGGMMGEISRYRILPNLDLPRYHQGLGPGERMSITTNDESVMTPGQRRDFFRLAQAQSPAAAPQTHETHVHLTINALDSRSVTQTLAQHQEQIVGLVNQAYNKRGQRGPLGR